MAASRLIAHTVGASSLASKDTEKFTRRGVVSGRRNGCFPRDVHTFCTTFPGDEKRHRASNELRVRTDIHKNFRLLLFCQRIWCTEERPIMSSVLITGANRGLGLEFARQYAADGWDVIATARNPKTSEQLQQLARNKNVSLHDLDVTRDESIKQLAETLSGKPVDLLVLNSAIYTRNGNKLGELNFAGWRESFETNVLGAIRVAEALIENVAASNRKQIVAISTGMGSLQALGSTIEFGIAYQYRTSKAALNMTMSILAKEVEPRGISVVIFSPGWVQTDMGGANAALTPEQSIGGMRKVLEGNPMELTGKFLGHDGATWPW
jgi:NAD(P)-dependent dehydrogenase (short-subunit alcohol dehydrogenase family)